MSRRRIKASERGRDKMRDRPGGDRSRRDLSQQQMFSRHCQDITLLKRNETPNSSQGAFVQISTKIYNKDSVEYQQTKGFVKTINKQRQVLSHATDAFGSACLPQRQRGGGGAQLGYERPPCSEFNKAWQRVAGICTCTRRQISPLRTGPTCAALR